MLENTIFQRGQKWSNTEFWHWKNEKFECSKNNFRWKMLTPKNIPKKSQLIWKCSPGIVCKIIENFRNQEENDKNRRHWRMAVKYFLKSVLKIHSENYFQEKKNCFCLKKNGGENFMKFDEKWWIFENEIFF